MFDARAILVASLIVVEVLLTGYCALIALLMCGWMVDDSEAFAMSDSDWWIAGGGRLIAGVMFGLFFGVGIYAINHLTLRRWRPEAYCRVLRWLAPAMAALVVAAGATGAVKFVIERPFM